MKLVFLLLKYSRRTFALALIAGLLSGASSTGLLAVINSQIINESPTSAALILTYAGLCLVLLASRSCSEVLLTRLGQDAHFDLRIKLSRQILAAPLRHLEELGTPRLLASLTEDVPVITNALMVIPNLCIACTVLAGGLIYLAWLSWTTLLATLVLIVLGVASYHLQARRVARSFRIARDYADILFKHFGALTEGIKELKLHRERRAAFLDGELRGTALSVRQHNVRGLTIQGIALSWGQTLTFVALGALIFAFPRFREVDRNILASFTITILYLVSFIPVILAIVPALLRANIALKKLEELGVSLAAHTTEGREADGREAVSDWGALELRGVTHAYHRERENSSFVLGPLDLSFRPGESAFIIGGNGSGKTTLVKLLAGLYVPESGELSFNRLPVTDANRDWYRQHFSVLFSDFFLFDSLLGLGAPKLDARARQYLERLQLDHKVEVKDGVLSTTDLSRGQRKRLALLTAYLEDRPVYIFDEWAADQDPLFKEFFYLSLLPELKARGKTVIVISHDDHYYYMADRILKLDYGRIESDRRSPDPLLAVGAGNVTTSKTP